MAATSRNRPGVWGANRAYRWDCLRELLPLEERMGWDTLDLVKATVRGWRTKVMMSSHSATIAWRGNGTAGGPERGRFRGRLRITWATGSRTSSSARSTGRCTSPQLVRSSGVTHGPRYVASHGAATLTYAASCVGSRACDVCRPGCARRAAAVRRASRSTGLERLPVARRDSTNADLRLLDRSDVRESVASEPAHHLCFGVARVVLGRHKFLTTSNGAR